MATPLLEDLRKGFPDAHITAMCKNPICALLENNPYLDELFCFHSPAGWIRRFAPQAIIEKLRLGQYDVGILLTNSLSSAWWFWQGGVKERIGFAAHARGSLLTHPLSFPQAEEHLVQTYKRLLSPLGLSLSTTAPSLFLRPEEREEAHRCLQTFGIPKEAKIIGIHPGAAYGSAKCWPSERFKEVTNRLLCEHPDVWCVYFGDLKTASLIRDLCAGSSKRIVNLSGKTSIRQLAALIGECRVFLSNDSGPMHIADALGVKVVALFGSTNPRKTAPYRTRDVLYTHAGCSPCHKRVCPIDFRCMTGITSWMVYDKIEEALE